MLVVSALEYYIPDKKAEQGNHGGFSCSEAGLLNQSGEVYLRTRQILSSAFDRNTVLTLARTLGTTTKTLPGRTIMWSSMGVQVRFSTCTRAWHVLE